MSKSVVTIPEAVPLTGRPYSTLWVWVKTLPEWQACISHRAGRRIYLSVERMRAAGLLLAETARA